MYIDFPNIKYLEYIHVPQMKMNLNFLNSFCVNTLTTNEFKHCCNFQVGYFREISIDRMY